MKNKEQKNMFIKKIFKVVSQYGQQNISNGIVLIANSNQLFNSISTMLQSANNQTSTPNQYIYKLNQKVILVNSFDSFIKPQTNMNFISTHYLLKMMKQPKYLLIIDSSQTKLIPLNNIQNQIVSFLSFFHFKNQQNIQLLSESCGIVICNCDSNNPLTYIYRIVGQKFDKGILEEGYVDTNNYKCLQTFMKGIINNNKIFLMINKQDYKQNNNNQQLKNDFLLFLSKIKSLQTLSIINLSSLITYNKQYIEFNIQKQWQSIFKSLYQNIDKIILNSQQNQNLFSISELQCYVDKLMMIQFKYKEQKLEQGINDDDSLHLLKLIYRMIQLIYVFLEQEIGNSIQDNQRVVLQYINSLYECKYIRKPYLKYFLQQYFTIFHFLSDKTCNQQSDIFHKIDFISIIKNKEIFNEKLRYLILKFFEKIESKDNKYKSNKENDELIQYLSKVLLKINHKEFSFCTKRIYKKLMRYRAMLQYNSIKLYKNEDSNIIFRWYKFLQFAYQCELIEETYKIEALIYIANHLIKNITNDIENDLINHSSILFAISLYNLLPEYKISSRLLYFYQQTLHLDYQTFKYASLQTWTHFIYRYSSNYCDFLLKLGYREKVRNFCYECLQLSQNYQWQQCFKRYLIEANNNGIKNLHNKFLEKSIINDKIIKIDRQLLDKIKIEIYNSSLF